MKTRKCPFISNICPNSGTNLDFFPPFNSVQHMSVGDQGSICCQIPLRFHVKRLQHHLLAKKRKINRKTEYVVLDIRDAFKVFFRFCWHLCCSSCMYSSVGIKTHVVCDWTEDPDGPECRHHASTSNHFHREVKVQEGLFLTSHS